MIEKCIQTLKNAILDYLHWMASEGYSPSTCRVHKWALSRFLLFISHKDIAWDEIFTLHTLKTFQQESKLKYVPGLRGFSNYLFEQNKISQPIKRRSYSLPPIYEEYIFYVEKSREITQGQVVSIRRLLSAFNDFLEKLDINLPDIKIAHIDAFLAEFTENLSPGTCRLYRTFLRGFLKYLYYERNVLEKDLAPLVVGVPLFAQAKPPKFLRSQELQQFFKSLELTTPTHIRTYAMVHLAFYMGLRPKEISKIKLDDLSFKKKALNLRERKGNNPMIRA
jgi:site-specific recombinase XerD